MRHLSKLTSTSEGSTYVLAVTLTKGELERCYAEGVSQGYGGDFSTIKGVIKAGDTHGLLVELALLRVFLANVDLPPTTKKKITKKKVSKRHASNIRRRKR